jgi:hypothetical protein
MKEKILTFTKTAFSPKYLSVTLIVIIAILFVFNWQTCNNNKKLKEEAKIEKKINAQNVKATQDSIHEIYNKITKSFEFYKASYVLTKEDLKNYNLDLYNEFKDFKGDVVAAIKAELSGILPDHTIGNQVIDYGNNKYGLKWTQDQGDEWFKQHIEGLSLFRLQYNTNKDSISIFDEGTKLTNNTTNVSIKFAHTKIKQNDTMATYQVEAICGSPFVKLISLDGAYFIDSKFPKNTTVNNPKVSRLTFGPYVGYGLELGAGNIINHGIQLGAGVQYNLRWKDLKFWK